VAADFNPNGPVPFSALQLERYVEPEFPAAFAGQGIEGWVDVKLAIAADGSIRSVELIDTNLPPDFLPPSRAAALQWRFKPFVWSGIAMTPSTTVRLTYSN
jgi:outer membrane biosynthesis protein TonB